MRYKDSFPNLRDSATIQENDDNEQQLFMRTAQQSKRNQLINSTSFNYELDDSLFSATQKKEMISNEYAPSNLR